MSKLSKQKNIDKNIGTFLNYFIGFLKLFRKKRQIQNPKKIIIYKLDAIGDAILCLPFIKLLKEKTNAKIIVACSIGNFDVFEGQNFIDKIILFDSSGLNIKKLIKNIKKLRKEKSDIVLDGGQSSNISAIISYLTGKTSIGFRKTKGKSRNIVYDYLVEINPNIHMVKNFMKLSEKIIGNNKIGKIELIKLKYSKKDSEKIDSLLKNKKNLVGIHPCHSEIYKRWPEKDFAKIIEYLAIKNNVVIVGSKDEEKDVKNLINKVNKKYINKIVNLSGKINIKELFALMPKLRLFIANDGGPMHIAAAMGTPIIGLFSHESPNLYEPWSKKAISIDRKAHQNNEDIKKAINSIL